MDFKNVTHVIFDMDGLLIDSETGYDRVMQSIAQRFGKVYTNEIKSKILGTPEHETARIAIQELKLPLSLDEFLSDYHAKVDVELVNPPLMSGVTELVRHLHKHKIPMAVATSSSDKAMKMKSQKHQEIFKLFNHIVCGSSDPAVKNGKPAPDIFLICASRFPDKPKPEKCLVFEDAPNGVRAAKSAGMQAVMVPDPIISDELKKPATLVLNSLKEFQPQWFGLPAFD